MNKYTIYCTQEQTKKALELGAPIELKGEVYYPNGAAYPINPTAEQMIGFLEGERGMKFLTGIDDEDKFFFNVYHNEGYIEVRGCDSRKEATLAAIDAALEYLSNKKYESV